MKDRRSYVHRRFGPSVARIYLRAWFALLLVNLLVLLFAFAVLLAAAPLAVHWLGFGLSLVALVLSARMYRSGAAALVPVKLPDAS